MTTAKCLAEYRALQVKAVSWRLQHAGLTCAYIDELAGFYLYGGPRRISIVRGTAPDRLLWPLEDAQKLVDQINVFGRATAYELVLRNPVLNYMRYTTVIVRAAEVPLERACTMALSNDCEIHEMTEVKGDGR